MTDLDQLESLARAATPGPWRTGRSSAWHGGYVCIMPSDKGQDCWIIEPAGYIDEASAAYIAAANPATVLQLCAELRELRRQRGALAASVISTEEVAMDYGSESGHRDFVFRQHALDERWPNWRSWAEGDE